MTVKTLGMLSKVTEWPVVFHELAYLQVNEKTFLPSLDDYDTYTV